MCVYTALPLAPDNIRITHSTNNTAVIVWKKPNDAGTLPVIWYSAECKNSTVICTNVTFHPVGSTLHQTNVTLRNLTPFTKYSIAIYAGNNVSESAPKDKWRFGMVHFRTDPGCKYITWNLRKCSSKKSKA